MLAAERLAAPDADGLLRFLTCGSVDDGKSTLIGRLLLDTKSILADALHAIERTSQARARGGGPLAPHRRPAGRARAGHHHRRRVPLLLRPARASTSSPTRPGHEQYTRNMVTAASTANLADDPGRRAQGRAHADAAPLVPRAPGRHPAPRRRGEQDGPRRLVGRGVRADPRRVPGVRGKLGISDVRFIPLSALEGDMVVERGANLPWYGGPTLLELLEDAPPCARRGSGAVPVPRPVGLPAPDARAPRLPRLHGRVESGEIRVGDAVQVLPSGRTTRVKEIRLHDESLARAVSEQSVTLLLEDELDISRGDLLVRAGEAPEPDAQGRRDAVLALGAAARGRTQYLVRHTTREVRATIARSATGVDLGELASGPPPPSP